MTERGTYEQLLHNREFIETIKQFELEENVSEDNTENDEGLTGEVASSKYNVKIW